MLFEEILEEADTPPGLKVGTAGELLGYTSPGEASDWIMAATGIPAISPELGTEDKGTMGFRIDDEDLVIDVMDQAYPIIEKTMEKLKAKFEFKPVGTVKVDKETSEFKFLVDHKNIGLTDM